MLTFFDIETVIVVSATGAPCIYRTQIAPPDDVEEGEGQRSLHERAEEEQPLLATTELKLDRLGDVVSRDARQSLHVRHDLVLEVDLELAVHGAAGGVGGVEVFAQARVCGVHGVTADAGLAQNCNRQ